MPCVITSLSPHDSVSSLTESTDASAAASQQQHEEPPNEADREEQKRRNYIQERYERLQASLKADTRTPLPASPVFDKDGDASHAADAAAEPVTKPAAAGGAAKRRATQGVDPRSLRLRPALVDLLTRPVVEPPRPRRAKGETDENPDVGAAAEAEAAEAEVAEAAEVDAAEGHAHESAETKAARKKQRARESAKRGKARREERAREAAERRRDSYLSLFPEEEERETLALTDVRNADLALKRYFLQALVTSLDNEQYDKFVKIFRRFRARVQLIALNAGRAEAAPPGKNSPNFSNLHPRARAQKAAQAAAASAAEELADAAAEAEEASTTAAEEDDSEEARARLSALTQLRESTLDAVRVPADSTVAQHAAASGLALPTQAALVSAEALRGARALVAAAMLIFYRNAARALAPHAETLMPMLVRHMRTLTIGELERARERGSSTRMLPYVVGFLPQRTLARLHTREAALQAALATATDTLPPGASLPPPAAATAAGAAERAVAANGNGNALATASASSSTSASASASTGESDGWSAAAASASAELHMLGSNDLYRSLDIETDAQSPYVESRLEYLARQGHKVFVTNIPPTATTRELMQAFAHCGVVLAAEIFRTPTTERAAIMKQAAIASQNALDDAAVSALHALDPATGLAPRTLLANTQPSDSADQQQFQHKFSRVAEPSSVHAYVYFATAEGARRALLPAVQSFGVMLHDVAMGTHPASSRRSITLFGLRRSLSHSDVLAAVHHLLRDVLPTSSIERLRLPTDQGRNTGACYIHFYTHADASAAFRALNGAVVAAPAYRSLSPAEVRYRRENARVALANDGSSAAALADADGDAAEAAATAAAAGDSSAVPGSSNAAATLPLRSSFAAWVTMRAVVRVGDQSAVPRDRYGVWYPVAPREAGAPLKLAAGERAAVDPVAADDALRRAQEVLDDRAADKARRLAQIRSKVSAAAAAADGDALDADVALEDGEYAAAAVDAQSKAKSKSKSAKEPALNEAELAERSVFPLGAGADDVVLPREGSVRDRKAVLRALADAEALAVEALDARERARQVQDHSARLQRNAERVLDPRADDPTVRKASAFEGPGTFVPLLREAAGSQQALAHERVFLKPAVSSTLIDPARTIEAEETAPPAWHAGAQSAWDEYHKDQLTSRLRARLQEQLADLEADDEDGDGGFDRH